MARTARTIHVVAFTTMYRLFTLVVTATTSSPDSELRLPAMALLSELVKFARPQRVGGYVEAKVTDGEDIN